MSFTMSGLELMLLAVLLFSSGAFVGLLIGNEPVD